MFFKKYVPSRNIMARMTELNSVYASDWQV
jgi:hypothetical protein